MLYNFLKNAIAFGLHGYHKKITVHGLEQVPKDKPVLFLPNHQSALLDVLLVGIKCNRKPYFLTRSDVFATGLLRTFFSYLRMIPIYRIRDGRSTLAKNDAIFDISSEVLQKGKALVMFPEANHNLERRVRPLSKGFTRVLFRALAADPKLDIHIVPVGLNYKNATHFPDEVAVYYGKPIAVQELYDRTDEKSSAAQIKNCVSEHLQQLTTHIQPQEHYGKIHSYLEALETDFLNPHQANGYIKNWTFDSTVSNTSKASVHNKIAKNTTGVVWYWVFVVLNYPLILLWKKGVKPKVWEDEFMGTLRFATALLGFAGYALLLLLVLAFSLGFWWAVVAVVVLVCINWFGVKQGAFANT